jgi:hypothetical protein
MFFRVKCSVYIVGHELFRWDDRAQSRDYQRRKLNYKKQTQNKPINGKHYFLTTIQSKALFTTNQGESL